MTTETPIAATRFGISIDGVQTSGTQVSSSDTFEFSTIENGGEPAGDINGADLNVLGLNWQGSTAASSDGERGLDGVVIYSDLNFDSATTSGFDLIL